jgi:hypothetical protein
MHEILNKAFDILPCIKWYGNAIVFYDVDNQNEITRRDVSTLFVERNFGDADTIVILKVKNNELFIKQIVVPKVSLRMLKVTQEDLTEFFFLEIDPNMQYHSLIYKNTKDAGNLNRYDNDQYIADLLLELEVKPENVFIEP